MKHQYGITTKELFYTSIQLSIICFVYKPITNNICPKRLNATTTWEYIRIISRNYKREANSSSSEDIDSEEESRRRDLKERNEFAERKKMKDGHVKYWKQFLAVRLFKKALKG